MSVSSTNDTILSTQTAKDIINTTYKDRIDLNDVLADLKHLTTIINNLTLVVSIYLDQKGELDTNRFRLVSTEQLQQEQQQEQPSK